MKRKDEITQSAKNKYPYIKGLSQSVSNQAVFIEAAEWADKTMIDKACEWLMKYFVLDHEGMSPSGYGVFEYMFRKAMEE